MRTSPLVATAEDPVLTPLRFPVIPYADESLPGLVARATREHVLEMTSVVLRRAGLRISEPAAICQAPAADLDRLAQVLRCEREDLRDRKNTCLNSSHQCASRMPASAFEEHMRF